MDSSHHLLKKLIILAIILAIPTIGIHQINAETAKGSTLKYDSKKHTIYTPKIGTIEDKITLAGSIYTDQIADVRFQNSGKLVWVGVKVGDKVKKGQALASLDKEELRKNLATQFNKYRTELTQFNDVQDQYKTTRDNVLVTDTIQRILDRTQYSLDNSVISYEISDMAIKEATIYSPISGIVTNIDQPFTNTYITPATATFTIINPDNLYFKSEIDQEQVNQVKNGQSAELQLDSFIDQSPINSKITYLSFTPVAGQTSTVYEIRFELPVNNSNLSYRLGMDGDASIVLAKADNAILIPTDSVYDDNGQKYVYLKKDNQLIRQDIDTGIETDTETQVLKGITENDNVIVIQS